MPWTPNHHAMIRAAAVTGLVCCASQASAVPELFWVFEDTGISATSQHTALGIRQGDAWPVIVDGDGNMYGRRTELLPNNFDFDNSEWFRMRSNLFPVGDDGPVISKHMGDNEPVFFQPAGFNVVSYTDPQGRIGNAGAYTPSGELQLAIPGMTYTQGRFVFGVNSPVQDMAIAPDGTVGVLASGIYYEYRFGQWGTGVYLQEEVGLWGFGNSLRLAFDAQSRPHIAGYVPDPSSQSVFQSVASFDTVTGQWTRTDFNNTFSRNATIAYNEEAGYVGIAWVEAGSPFNPNVESTLRLSILEPGGEWVTTTVVDQVNGFFTSVGLAFDDAGLPVISYIDGGTYWLAIDPILAEQISTVPEPTSLALMALATLALTRRRR